MTALDKLGIKRKKIKNNNYSEKQEQTKNTFSYKWSIRKSYDSEIAQKRMREWLFEKYCNNDYDKVKEWLKGGRKIILDAGCGSGYSALLLFGKLLNKNYYLGVDISDSIKVAKKRFKEMNIKGDFLQADILNLPIDENSVDIIFAEGVLHHTDNTLMALKYLSSKLKKNGLFLFYVYAKKSVIREFTDDYIREKLKPLSDEEAWESLKPLTKLGKEIGKLNVVLKIPEDVPILGIKKGEMDIQRFFYWNICKAYYRPEYDLEEMNHINFDWFRPLNCHRHTINEIKEYCKISNLKIENLKKEEAGFTVVARKK